MMEKMVFDNRPVITEKAKLIDAVKSTNGGVIVLTQRISGATYSGIIKQEYELSLKKFILNELESFDDQLTIKGGDINKKIVEFEVIQ